MRMRIATGIEMEMGTALCVHKGSRVRGRRRGKDLLAATLLSTGWVEAGTEEDTFSSSFSWACKSLPAPLPTAAFLCSTPFSTYKRGSELSAWPGHVAQGEREREEMPWLPQPCRKGDLGSGISCL